MGVTRNPAAENRFCTIITSNSQLSCRTVVAKYITARLPIIRIDFSITKSSTMICLANASIGKMPNSDWLQRRAKFSGNHIYFLFYCSGWGGRIRTSECQDQNLVPWATWLHPNFSESLNLQVRELHSFPFGVIITGFSLKSCLEKNRCIVIAKSVSVNR